MTQRFEKKMYNLFEGFGLHVVSFSELEVDLLFCVHVEVFKQEGGPVEFILPADTFLISCYQTESPPSFKSQFCFAKHNEHLGKACHLNVGKHLILIGKSAWLRYTLRRINQGKSKKWPSEMGSFQYSEAQISKSMLVRQAELIMQERLSQPKTMDLHGFVVLLLREWENVQELLSHVELGRDKWLVSQTKHLMEQHLEGQPLTLEMIAQTLAISVSKLKIAFRREMGVSVYRHYLNLRLDFAKTLLSSNKYNVSEVAYRIGYNSVSKFSKMFSEYHGMLPSYYCKSTLQLV